jgi:hypothetical protein
MVGAFVCAVLVIQPLAGAEPRWPHRADEAASAKTLSLPVALSLPRADVVPAARALAPGVVVRTRVPGVHRAAAKPVLRRPVDIDRVVAPPTRHAPARPVAPIAASSAPGAEPAHQTAPSPGPLAPVGDAVSSTARTAGQAVAPVSPEAGSAVEQAGAAVAQIVGGP